MHASLTLNTLYGPNLQPGVNNSTKRESDLDFSTDLHKLVEQLDESISSTKNTQNNFDTVYDTCKKHGNPTLVDKKSIEARVDIDSVSFSLKAINDESCAFYTSNLAVSEISGSNSQSDSVFIVDEKYASPLNITSHFLSKESIGHTDPDLVQKKQHISSNNSAILVNEEITQPISFTLASNSTDMASNMLENNSSLANATTVEVLPFISDTGTKKTKFSILSKTLGKVLVEVSSSLNHSINLSIRVAESENMKHMDMEAHKTDMESILKEAGFEEVDVSFFSGSGNDNKKDKKEVSLWSAYEVQLQPEYFEVIDNYGRDNYTMYRTSANGVLLDIVV